MSLNAVATSRCSVEPSTLRARVEVAVGERAAPRRRVRAAGLASEPARSQATTRPSSSATGAHADQREHVVALLGLHGVDALGHPHRARRPAVRRHRHGGEEEVLVQQVAVALALDRVGRERASGSPGASRSDRHARPRRDESASRRPRASTTITRPPRLSAELLDQSLELAAVAQPARGAGGHQLRLGPAPRS